VAITGGGGFYNFFRLVVVVVVVLLYIFFFFPHKTIRCDEIVRSIVAVYGSGNFFLLRSRRVV
jgi:hypothetical protein